MKRIISIGILIFILTGCGSTGPVLDKDTSEKLQESNTDEVEIVEKNEETVSEEQSIPKEEMVSEEQSMSKEETENKDIEDPIQDETENSEIDTGEDKNQDDKEKTDEQGTEVIAKSNNDVTSKEKEEILNEIDKLLDDMFKNIEEMDTVKDEDLVIKD